MAFDHCHGVEFHMVPWEGVFGFSGVGGEA